MRGIVLLAVLVAGCAAPAASAPSSAAPTASASATATASATAATVERPWVAYQLWGSGDRTHIGLVRDDGTDDHPLEVTGPPVDDQSHPAWSPDGTKVAFDVFFDDPAVSIGQRVEPWVVGLDGGPAERLASCTLPCLQLSYPDYSPDGRSLALIRYDVESAGDAWGISALDIVDLATGERRTVAETANGLDAWYRPRWSPDGTAIVVAGESYTDAGQETITRLGLTVITVDGPTAGATTTITPPDVLARDPDWGGPDGRIVFTRVPTLPADMDDAELSTILPDGSDLRPFAMAAFPGRAPRHTSWDPDGSRVALVFDDHSTAPPAIGIVGADGSGFAVIIDDDTPRTHPRIQPRRAPGG